MKSLDYKSDGLPLLNLNQTQIDCFEIPMNYSLDLFSGRHRLGPTSIWSISMPAKAKVT